MEKKLSIPEFVDRAPPEVVEKLKHSLEENKRKLLEIKMKLSKISI